MRRTIEHMNGDTLIKIGIWLLVAIVATRLLAELAGIIFSGWFLVAAGLVWWFGFRKNKKSADV